MLQEADQGMVKIKGLPTYHNVLRKLQSSSIVSAFNSAIVNAILSNRECTYKHIVIQKSAIGKSANVVIDPCKNSQIVMLLVKKQFGGLKANLLIKRAQRLYLVFQCSGGNKAKAKVLVVLQLV